MLTLIIIVSFANNHHEYLILMNNCLLLRFLPSLVISERSVGSRESHIGVHSKMGPESNGLYSPLCADNGNSTGAINVNEHPQLASKIAL